MPSNTMVNVEGANAVPLRTTGAETQRAIVVFSILADGTKMISFTPPRLFVPCQEKGWTKLLTDWIKFV